MSWVLGIVVLVAIGLLVLIKWQAGRARLAYLKQYRFHPSIVTRVSENFFFMADEEIDLIFEGLRDYFIICSKAKKKVVTMPSRAVDDAWRSFSLFTREYQNFCQKSQGRFIPYTPVDTMRASAQVREGIKLAWKLACQLEDIVPTDPDRLPRLFAIDGQLEVPEGFIYPLGRTRRKRTAAEHGFSSSELLEGPRSSHVSEGDSSRSESSRPLRQ